MAPMCKPHLGIWTRKQIMQFIYGAMVTPVHLLIDYYPGAVGSGCLERI